MTRRPRARATARPLNYTLCVVIKSLHWVFARLRRGCTQCSASRSPLSQPKSPLQAIGQKFRSELSLRLAVLPLLERTRSRPNDARHGLGQIVKRKDHGWEVIVEWHWPRPSDDFTTYLKTWRTKNPPELAKLREDVVQVSQVSSANFEVAHRDRDEGDVVKVRFDAKEGAFSSRGVGYA